MKRRILLDLICMMLVMSLTGCGSKSTYEPGAWAESRYTSSWLGFTYELPEDVSIITDDKLYANRYLFSGAFYDDSDEEYVRDLDEVVTIEMGVSCMGSRNKLWIITEKMPDDELTIDDFVDEYVKMVSGVMAEYEVVSDKDGVVIGNQTFREVKLSGDLAGVSNYQDLYITQKEDRIIYILIEYSSTDKDVWVPKLLSGLSIP